VASSSERIIEDVGRLLVVLDKIIADGTKTLGGKARMHQRIDTQEARPHHAKLADAYALLVNDEHAQRSTFNWLP
jgi:hypothetical protein